MSFEVSSKSVASGCCSAQADCRSTCIPVGLACRNWFYRFSVGFGDPILKTDEVTRRPLTIAYRLFESYLWSAFEAMALRRYTDVLLWFIIIIVVVVVWYATMILIMYVWNVKHRPTLPFLDGLYKFIQRRLQAFINNPSEYTSQEHSGPT